MRMRIWHQLNERRSIPIIGAAAAHLGGLDLLSGVQDASDVVVDGLLHGLALLQGLDLRVGKGAGHGGEARMC